MKLTILIIISLIISYFVINTLATLAVDNSASVKLTKDNCLTTIKYCKCK